MMIEHEWALVAMVVGMAVLIIALMAASDGSSDYDDSQGGA